ncbi:NUDIX domain-containing protein [Sediminibacterium sp.]|jgi:8-oxo-dGTP diphosphatase|uniref:NUDIX domain-containing protein n=1 Tax=Sediminibacterium sp. TaxID=1917865 RepID=UPI00271DBA10|nr:NUDIX domain-containing protein [Sediminibacterium sp.]MDO8997259.1 NUDIX domain-containing protein [Sediminibacterium sp.]MDO9156867.1 NUDIX domain-containing protein [Sediminibacterium sp.]MDP2421206.1 NUDIX domain-containing protein [Sediminibacterium sp.]
MPLFNVRVYGLLIDQYQRLLVTDEFIRGSYITKLPGGGLEFGEGTRACLQREFIEETGIEVNVGAHFYTTDFFQISAFNNKDQIISIYYLVHAADTSKIKTSEIPFNFSKDQVADPNGESEVFRWIPLKELTPESVTLPIDKVVIQLLKENA